MQRGESFFWRKIKAFSFFATVSARLSIGFKFSEFFIGAVKPFNRIPSSLRRRIHHCLLLGHVTTLYRSQISSVLLGCDARRGAIKHLWLVHFVERLRFGVPFIPARGFDLADGGRDTLGHLRKKRRFRHLRGLVGFKERLGIVEIYILVTGFCRFGVFGPFLELGGSQGFGNAFVKCGEVVIFNALLHR